MEANEYLREVGLLKERLFKLTKDYIDSLKLYNVGDVLKVSFYKEGNTITEYCKILNIYTLPDETFASLYHWPTSQIVYFARYCWVDENGYIQLGDCCHLGSLSNSEIICGHAGVEPDTVKIRVIKPSTLKAALRKQSKIN